MNPALRKLYLPKNIRTSFQSKRFQSVFLRYNLFALVWALIILALILIPGQQMPDFGDIFSFDKLAHLGVFAILCFLMIVGFSKQFTFSALQKSPVKYTLLFTVVYAGILELGQTLIPGRYANFYDLSFNMAGGGVGYPLFVLIYKFSFL